MEETFSTDGDLTRLAQRFIAETCVFLSENWNVDREWWPLRAGGRCGAAVGGGEPGIDRRPEGFAPAPEVLRAIRVVSLGLTRTSDHDIGLADTQFFVLVPCATWTGTADEQVRAGIALSPADDDEEPMEIWVPDTLGPPRITSDRQISLNLAG